MLRPAADHRVHQDYISDHLELTGERKEEEVHRVLANSRCRVDSGPGQVRKGPFVWLSLLLCFHAVCGGGTTAGANEKLINT